MAVERIYDDRFPDDSFFVFSKPGIEILKNVHVAGDTFKFMNFCTSVDFLKEAYKHTTIKNYPDEEVACLSVLRSGPHYCVPEAYHQITKAKMQSVTIGAKRKRMEDGKITAKIHSKDIKLLGKGVKHLVTSEIVASGSTLKAVFNYISSIYDIREWTIFSVAAAEGGCSLLKKLGEDNNIKVNLLVNGFIGGLKENETDIPFYHPSTLMPKKLEVILKEHYGKELFEKIPCCIGDGGDRFINPQKHCKEFIEVYSGIKVEAEKSSGVLAKMLKEAGQLLGS